MSIKYGWRPPVSPYGLIQESLWPNEWLILVSCVLLNCTTRSQVDRMLPTLIRRWPDPAAMSAARPEDVQAIVSSLGFGKRRAVTLIKLARDYLSPSWTNARQLAGIGEYAGRAWDIFCRGELGDTPPNDHALVAYWKWVTRT